MYVYEMGGGGGGQGGGTSCFPYILLSVPALPLVASSSVLFPTVKYCEILIFLFLLLPIWVVGDAVAEWLVC